MDPRIAEVRRSYRDLATESSELTIGASVEPDNLNLPRVNVHGRGFL
jgi:hypothetical protein